MCPHWWGYGGLAGIIGMLVFWAILIAGLYLLYRALAARGVFGPAGGGGETPRAILDRRLAAGEINTEEYDALRRKFDGT